MFAGCGEVCISGSLFLAWMSHLAPPWPPQENYATDDGHGVICNEPAAVLAMASTWWWLLLSVVAVAVAAVVVMRTKRSTRSKEQQQRESPQAARRDTGGCQERRRRCCPNHLYHLSLSLSLSWRCPHSLSSWSLPVSHLKWEKLLLSKEHERSDHHCCGHADDDGGDGGGGGDGDQVELHSL